MADVLNKEPTAIINGLSELLRQVLPLLIVLGVINLDSIKQAALTSMVGLILAFISTTLLRSQVVPIVKADAQIIQATKMEAGTTVQQVVAATEAVDRAA